MAELVPYLPEQSGYSATHPNQLISVRLSGGLSRVRADVDGASSFVTATWFLGQAQYQEMMDFLRRQAQAGVPFLCDLLLDFFVPSRYLCRLVPGTLSLTRVQGLTLRLSMQLEVETPVFACNSHQFGGVTLSRTQTSAEPQYDDIFTSGDMVGIYGAHVTDPVSVSLDGVYEIDSVINGNIMELVSPASVNPNWSQVPSLSGIVPFVGIVKVPT